MVRPSSKRDKKKRKRLQDPSRRGYKDILDKSGTEGTYAHMVEASIADDHHGSGATDAEAAAVLAAIGYKPGPGFEEVTPLQRTQSGKSDATNISDRSSPNDLKSPGVVMKSPELLNLESPALSEASSEGEDEDEDEEDDDDGGGGIEAVPGHVLLAQDEANQKAREEEEGNKIADDDTVEEGRMKGGTGLDSAELVENIKPKHDTSAEGTENQRED